MPPKEEAKDEEQFKEIAPDWLLILLGSVSKRIGAQILLMCWRQLCNHVIHGNSTRFLISY